MLGFRLREDIVLVRHRQRKRSIDYKVFFCIFLSILFCLLRNAKLYGIFDVSLSKLHEINRLNITVVIRHGTIVEGG